MGLRVESALALGCWLFVACQAPDAGEPELVELSSAQAETDQQPAGSLWLGSTELRDVVATARGPAATFAVTAGGALVRLAGGRSTTLLVGALGRPAALPDGGVVVARRSDEPGETDLWLVSAAGSARALASAPGPDDLPIAIPDGRVAFVSARTSVASLWVVDPGSDAPPRQLTNRGLAAGGARVGFVPPPVEVIEATHDHLVYDTGGGARWRVALADGAASPSPEGAR